MSRRWPSSNPGEASCVRAGTKRPLRSVTVALIVTTSTPLLKDGWAAISDNSAMERARQLRLIGTLVMIIGVVAAAAVYWLQTRAAAIDDAAAGFTRAQAHQ